MVDFILAAEDIPGKLVQIRSVYATEKNEEFDGEPSGSESKSDAFKKILSFVLNYKGVDFDYYKKPTVFRRINRRMAINQMEKYEDYLNLLRENRVEQEALFQDLLIKVTSFFRDPEVFEESLQRYFSQTSKKSIN